MLEFIEPENVEEYNYEYLAPPTIVLNDTVTKVGRGSRESKVSAIISLVKDGRQYISRLHGEIVKIMSRDGEISYDLRDTNAMNGLFVNDVRITSHILQEGDIIQFGGISVTGAYCKNSVFCLIYWCNAETTNWHNAGQFRHLSQIPVRLEAKAPAD